MADSQTLSEGLNAGASQRRFSEAEGLWARSLGRVSFVIYWGIHASCLLALVTGVSATDLALCLGLFVFRVIGITAGYHRYFAHKTYKTSRAFQFVLALWGCCATQKGPLWWAGHHRVHHKYADRPGKDVHTPKDGWWYSHQGWIFDPKTEATPIGQIPDMARFPELIWLNRWYIVSPIAVAVFCYAVGGFSGLVWGFSISQILVWHATYCINSLAHVWGTRRYETPDTSRNNALLALITMGEGWHNNHHRYCSAARNGFFWWEVDVTYYVLRGLAAVGLIWDLREVPESVLRPERRELDEAA